MTGKNQCICPSREAHLECNTYFPSKRNALSQQNIMTGKFPLCEFIDQPYTNKQTNRYNCDVEPLSLMLILLYELRKIIHTEEHNLKVWKYESIQIWIKAKNE